LLRVELESLLALFVVLRSRRPILKRTSGQIRRIKHVEMLRSVTLCAIPSSHFTGFDKEIAEMILGKDSDDSCLKDNDHGVGKRTIETVRKVKEVDEMAVIPEGPDKLAEATASARG
jgi:hypothetical protein